MYGRNKDGQAATVHTAEHTTTQHGSCLAVPYHGHMGNSGACGRLNCGMLQVGRQAGIRKVGRHVQ